MAVESLHQIKYTAKYAFIKVWIRGYKSTTKSNPGLITPNIVQAKYNTFTIVFERPVLPVGYLNSYAYHLTDHLSMLWMLLKDCIIVYTHAINLILKH